MLKNKTIQKRKPTAQADGCDLALKGSLACIDQTQLLTAKVADEATLWTTSNNTPAGGHSSSPLCNSSATPPQVKAPALGSQVHLADGSSQVRDFKTGDIAKARVPTGKNEGCWIGRVVTRMSGWFRVGPQNGISYRYLTQLQQADGYQYQSLTPALSSLPCRNRVSSAIII